MEYLRKNQKALAYSDRAKTMMNAAQILDDEVEEFARLITMEMGNSVLKNIIPQVKSSPVGLP